MPEHWTSVIDWEDLYEISDLGQVRSKDRMIHYRDGRTRFYPGTILKQCINKNGYPYVGLSRDGKTTRQLVHWLVGSAFLGPRPDGYHTRHGPGGPGENKVTHLSYGTVIQNAEDTLRDGTRAIGTRLPQAKLTDDIVRECRARYAAGGVTIKDLADKFGVSTSTMNFVIRRKTWKHVI